MWLYQKPKMSFEGDTLLLNTSRVSVEPSVKVKEINRPNENLEDETTFDHPNVDADVLDGVEGMDDDIDKLYKTYMSKQGEEDDFPQEDEADEPYVPPSPPPRFNPRQNTPRSSGNSGNSNAKREILYKLNRLKRKGVVLPREYTMDDDLEDMQAMLERIEKDMQVDKSIEFQRQMMVTFVTGIELLNNKFDPVGAKLDGWSNSIADGISDYDEVFEELHFKYKGKVKMPPEMQLLFMLSCSGVMFHLSNTIFKNFPDLGNIFRNNPDLASHFMSAAANTMGPGAPQADMANMFASMFANTGGPSAAVTEHHSSRAPSPVQNTIKGPTVDIRQVLDQLSNTQNVPAMDGDTVSVVTTVSDTLTSGGGRGRGGKKQRKGGVSAINTLDLDL